MVVPAAAQQGGGGRHEAGYDRERERLVQPGFERRRDQMGEERSAGKERAAVRAHVGENVTSDQVFDWVISKESGEQDGDGGQVGGVGSRCRVDPVSAQATGDRGRQRSRQTRDHQVKKMPTDATWAEF